MEDEEQGIYRDEVTTMMWKLADIDVTVRKILASPVARALVVLWQAGPNGYRPKGRGSVLTDRAGRFRFEGPVPANYGRGAHIHIAVFHPAYEELASRYAVRGSTRTGRIRLVLTPLL